MAPLFAAMAIIAIGTVRNAHTLLDTDVLFWGAIYYCYTLGAALIVGLPTYLVLKRFNKVTWWSSLTGGMFSGVVTTIVFGPPILLFTVIGGLSGLVFWLIWRTGFEGKQVRGAGI